MLSCRKKFQQFHVRQQSEGVYAAIIDSGYRGAICAGDIP